MDRALVVIGARPLELALKTGARQQEIGARGAVLECQAMRRPVVIGPGDTFAGSDRDLRRREGKVRDRDLRTLLRCGRRLRSLGADCEGERMSKKDTKHGAQRPY